MHTLLESKQDIDQPIKTILVHTIFEYHAVTFEEQAINARSADEDLKDNNQLKAQLKRSFLLQSKRHAQTEVFDKLTALNPEQMTDKQKQWIATVCHFGLKQILLSLPTSSLKYLTTHLASIHTAVTQVINERKADENARDIDFLDISLLDLAQHGCSQDQQTFLSAFAKSVCEIFQSFAILFNQISDIATKFFTNTKHDLFNMLPKDQIQQIRAGHFQLLIAHDSQLRAHVEKAPSSQRTVRRADTSVSEHSRVSTNLTLNEDAEYFDDDNLFADIINSKRATSERKENSSSLTLSQSDKWECLQSAFRALYQSNMGVKWSLNQVTDLQGAIDKRSASVEYDPKLAQQLLREHVDFAHNSWSPMHLQVLNELLKDPTLSTESLNRIIRGISTKAEEALRSKLPPTHRDIFDAHKGYHHDNRTHPVRFHHAESDIPHRTALTRLFNIRESQTNIDHALRATSKSLLTMQKQGLDKMAMLGVLAATSLIQSDSLRSHAREQLVTAAEIKSLTNLVTLLINGHGCPFQWALYMLHARWLPYTTYGNTITQAHTQLLKTKRSFVDLYLKFRDKALAKLVNAFASPEGAQFHHVIAHLDQMHECWKIHIHPYVADPNTTLAMFWTRVSMIFMLNASRATRGEERLRWNQQEFDWELKKSLADTTARHKALISLRDATLVQIIDKDDCFSADNTSAASSAVAPTQPADPPPTNSKSFTTRASRSKKWQQKQDQKNKQRQKDLNAERQRHAADKAELRSILQAHALQMQQQQPFMPYPRLVHQPLQQHQMSGPSQQMQTAMSIFGNNTGNNTAKSFKSAKRAKLSAPGAQYYDLTADGLQLKHSAQLHTPCSFFEGRGCRKTHIECEKPHFCRRCHATDHAVKDCNAQSRF